MHYKVKIINHLICLNFCVVNHIFSHFKPFWAKNFHLQFCLPQMITYFLSHPSASILPTACGSSLPNLMPCMASER